MKSFVVMTYYQLMHSIAMALSLDEKPMLYFSKNYLDIQDDFLDRIRATGVFKKVVGITGRRELFAFIAELNKTKEYSTEEVDQIGNSIFEKYLEPYYSLLFKDADVNDEIFIYNDFQWHYYYIEKHFQKIVGVEDGYASLEQQLRVHRFKGDHKLVEKFTGKYYPEPLYRSPKMQRIISSKYFDSIPDYYKNKLQVIDYNDLINLNEKEFKEAVLAIFGISDYSIEDNSTLFLSQPLARAQYCTSLTEYLMYKKILNEEVSKGNNVYYKAHPADAIDARMYESDSIHILPKSFPVELLNYKGCRFKKILSFGSTGVKTLSCADSFQMIFQKPNADNKEIKDFIKQMTQGETLRLRVIILVSHLNLDTYVNVYSGFYSRWNYFNTEAVVVVPTGTKDKAERYFDKKNLAEKIEKYIKRHEKNGVCIWAEELELLKRQNSGIHNPQVIECENLLDEESIIKALEQSTESYDYVLIVDEKTLMFSLIKNIRAEVRKRVSPCIVFQKYTEIPEKKMAFPYAPVCPEYIDSSYLGSLTNVVWHKSLFDIIINETETDRIRLLTQYIKEGIPFPKKYSDDLYVPHEMYSTIEDGFNYYLNRANHFAEEEYDDIETLIIILAKEMISYLDWMLVTNKVLNSDSLSEMIDRINITDELKEHVLAKVSITLYYEHYRRYLISADEKYELGKFLRREIGLSSNIIVGTQKIKRIRKRGKRIIKKVKAH